VNADGLQSAGRHASLKSLKFTANEQPLIAQIWGKHPDNFYKTAQELVGMGFVGIDINMGCPDKAVLKNGCGGALSQNPTLAIEMIKAVQAGVNGKIPVSVKTRIGFREYDENWLRILLEQKLNMLSVHLRTVREMSKVAAHWELMSHIKALRDQVAPHTALVGNGDVKNREQANVLAKKYGIDGVMIGRGIFHDPFACNLESGWEQTPAVDKINLYLRHIELFEQTWSRGQEIDRPIITLNKFCKIYINGFAGAKDCREQLMQCRSIAELKSNIKQLKLQLRSQVVTA
jgi:tRNA-dihydrouridine synthase